MSNKTFIAIIVVVVVVGIGIVFFAVYKGPHSGSGAGTSPSGSTAGAAQQFPNGLIIDPNSAVTPNYSSATGQYTASYTSTDPAATLYTAYKNYFVNDGWHLTSVSAPEDGLAGGFSARSTTGGVVTVTITQESSGSQVTVDFTP